MGGLLSVVGTPIGNLEDASPRVRRVLGEADVVLCEDTRVTGRLMNAFGLHVRLERCDENIMAEKIDQVLGRLAAGESVAFVSDAGMPGVSDPGQRLVDAALDAGVRVEVVPGPSAVTCALVASGLASEHFFFEGFLPRKRGAQLARLAELAAVPGTLVVYESPRRVAETLANVAANGVVNPGESFAYMDGKWIDESELVKAYDEDGEDYQINEIPTFTAYIDYSGATIEDPGSQDYGYRDRSYSIDDFEVIALEGYASDYTLYYIDEDRLADDQLTDGQAGFTYEDCVDRAYELFFAENAPYANAVVEINVYNSDVSEDDDEWDDTDNAYQWNPDSSLSFTPQRSGIYLVNLTVTETTGATVSSYMAIEVRNPVDIIPGVSEWLQNNTVSVVLFSISGVLLIAIIVLCVVKPSDKKVEEVDIEKLKGKKKSKKD